MCISLRNKFYDYWALPIWLEVPVISVGNLTVGGTGKTPLALWLCQQMLKRGRKPAVLSRGYKASRGVFSDELMLIARRCSKAVVIANPNRVAAGRLAVAEFGAQAAILDDGFQHRRVGRDLDIVLIDASRPFGYEHLLPRGLLREPIHELQRAHVVIVTRCDQCEPGTLVEIDRRIRAIHPNIPITHAVHKTDGFTDLQGNQTAPPSGARIGCFAGIARPDAFVRTLTDMHITPAEIRYWPDHHQYTQEDVDLICAWVHDAKLDALVTTEKDAVKLALLDADWPIPVTSLRINIEILDDGNKILTDLIDKMLLEYEEYNEPGTDLEPSETH